MHRPPFYRQLLSTCEIEDTEVHVGDALASELSGDDGEPGMMSLDLEYLERLGVADRLPAWREMAEDEVGAPDPEA
ncbi:MAG: hypothetical protein V3T14_11785 [Myxococcota bacterium]